ncbi:XPA protein C-terminus-domain-containing protein [Polychytrium aggregatum]|uniref:XPA protein C-terminus-domain-containing protein n=1 Tax=Polychytrium aggregatum TaxID=110093 RepID=UPI0022FDD6F5|nr:XPA protein C-terminus-domain-containing protein [Polychytrium aggregatum]KAI9205494.1 XPA protein C-terminus-domain-containing protein [Polychytrium aggregatum]
MGAETDTETVLTPDQLDRISKNRAEALTRLQLKSQSLPPPSSLHQNQSDNQSQSQSQNPLTTASPGTAPNSHPVPGATSDGSPAAAALPGPASANPVPAEQSSGAPADAASGDVAKPSQYQRRKRALEYCEYNLTTMVDTKGGFLYSTEPEDKKAKIDDQSKPAKEGRFLGRSGCASEAIRLHRFELLHPTSAFDPAQLGYQPQCCECQSYDIHFDYLRHFGVSVCKKCKDTELFSLLTKTECKEDYLLTDCELKDRAKVRVWERPNPHKSTWAPMQLFLRKQVEAFAWEKWGSSDALDQEFERRDREKREKAEKMQKEKMKTLRRTTMTSVYRKPKSQAHTHEYGPGVYSAEADNFTQTCSICGATQTYDEI